MSVTSHIELSLRCAVTALLSVLSAQGAELISSSAIWPTSPAVETVDVISDVTTVAGYGLGQDAGVDRRGRQTFQVHEEFKLDEIFFPARNVSGTQRFTIKFFQVSDITAANWTAGTQVGSTILVNAPGAEFSTTDDIWLLVNLRVKLSSSEQFVLPVRNTGVQGYGIELRPDYDGAYVTFPFIWLHANEANLQDYAPGRFYVRDGTGQPLYRDLGLAITAVPMGSIISIR